MKKTFISVPMFHWTTSASSNKFLTVFQASEFLGIPKDRVEELIKSFQIRCITTSNGLTLIASEEIERFIEYSAMLYLQAEMVSSKTETVEFDTVTNKIALIEDFKNATQTFRFLRIISFFDKNNTPPELYLKEGYFKIVQKTVARIHDYKKVVDTTLVSQKGIKLINQLAKQYAYEAKLCNPSK